ncbi:MAG: hypothetical protein IKF75_01780 [Lachnospiraceae bacterium]|nr:hypothetical protein [Lachnospiraceae bacterium]
MKAFKGFNKDMTCRGFQYEEGKTYEEDQARLCDSGFHACEDPLGCLSYYPPAQSVYREVELDDVSDEIGDDSKRVGKKIQIGAEIDIAGISKGHFDYVKERTTIAIEKGDAEAATAGNCGAATAGEYGAATAGNRGAATAGNCGAATAGEYGAATAGEYGAATAGNRGAATAGNCGAATAGEYGAATAGNCGAATAGNCGAATAGEYGAATSRGSSASGENGLSVARGNGVKVKGGLGAILVIAEEEDYNHNIVAWKAVEVDGEKIKADTWYRLEGGELEEIKE